MNLMRLALRLALACTGLVALPAHAAITCSLITTPAMTINYPANTAQTRQSYFRVTCNRPNGDAQTSVTYTVTTDRGQNFQGQNKRAALGGARIPYLTASGSGCTPNWRQAVTISTTMTWTAGAWGTQTVDSPFWLCIASINPASAGLYTDTVLMTMTYPGGTLTANLGVNILAPASCTVTTQPGNISILGYVPFTSGVRTGSTTLRIQCTNTMQYTVATDVPEGVLVGLRYTLAVTPAADVGTGAPKQHTVTATVPAGQAGAACALPSGSVCSASNNHTVVITY